MLNIVKHLAKCPGKVLARDPSFLRMTPLLRFSCWTISILLPSIMYIRFFRKVTIPPTAFVLQLIGYSKCFRFRHRFRWKLCFLRQRYNPTKAESIE